MNTSSPSLLRLSITAAVLATLAAAPKTLAVDALLLQDTYVDNGATGTKPPPNLSNYGSGADLRVFKGSGRIGRSFIKFNIATVPPGATPANIVQARLLLWVNGNSTLPGSITIIPVTVAWDELKLTDTTAGSLTFGAPKLADIPVSNVANFISIDVTDLVKGWLNGSLVNEGLMIEASTSATTLNLAFDSKESTLTSHAPQLEIVLAQVGPQGPQGLAGPQGLQGLPGVQGAKGDTGAQGQQGPAGAKGDKGDTGAQGSQGVAGAQGATGLAGPAGPAGLNGAQGPTGAVGPEGPAGPAGPQGPAGTWPTRLEPQGDLSMGEFTQGPTP